MDCLTHSGIVRLSSSPVSRSSSGPSSVAGGGRDGGRDGGRSGGGSGGGRRHQRRFRNRRVVCRAESVMVIMMLVVSGMALAGSLLLLPMRLPRIGLGRGLVGPRKLVYRHSDASMASMGEGEESSVRTVENTHPNKSLHFSTPSVSGSTSFTTESMSGSLTASTSASMASNSSRPPSGLPSSHASPSLAICLVGSPRDFHITGPSIKRHLLSAYPSASTHVVVNSPFDHTSARLLALALASPQLPPQPLSTSTPPLSTPPPPLSTPLTPPNASRVLSPLEASPAPPQVPFPLDPAFSRVSLVRISPHVPLPVSPQASRVLSAEGSPSGAQGLLQYFHLVEGCASLIALLEHCASSSSSSSSSSSPHRHQPVEKQPLPSPYSSSSSSSTSSSPPRSPSPHPLHFDYIIRSRLDSFWAAPAPPLSSLHPPSSTLTPAPAGAAVSAASPADAAATEAAGSKAPATAPLSASTTSTSASASASASDPALSAIESSSPATSAAHDTASAVSHAPSASSSSATAAAAAVVAVPLGSEWGGLNDRFAMGPRRGAWQGLMRLAAVAAMDGRGIRGVISEQAWQEQLSMTGTRVLKLNVSFCVLTRRFTHRLSPTTGNSIISCNNTATTNSSSSSSSSSSNNSSANLNNCSRSTNTNTSITTSISSTKNTTQSSPSPLCQPYVFSLASPIPMNGAYCRPCTHPCAPASSPAAAAAFNSLPSPPSLHHGSAFPLFRAGMELCPAVDTLGDDGDWEGDWGGEEGGEEEGGNGREGGKRGVGGGRKGEGDGRSGQDGSGVEANERIGKEKSEKERGEEERSEKERGEKERWQDGVARVAGPAAVQESEKVEQWVRDYSSCLALFHHMRAQPHVTWMAPPPEVICTRARLGPSVPLASSPGLAPFPLFLNRLSYTSAVVCLSSDPSLTDLFSMELRLLLPGIQPRCMDWQGRTPQLYGGDGDDGEGEGEGEGERENDGDGDGEAGGSRSTGDDFPGNNGGGDGGDGAADSDADADEQSVVDASRRILAHIKAHGPLDVLVVPEVLRAVRTVRAWRRDQASLPVCQLMLSVPPPLEEASAYHTTFSPPSSPPLSPPLSPPFSPPLSPSLSPHLSPDLPAAHDDPLTHYTHAFSSLLSDLRLLGFHLAVCEADAAYATHACLFFSVHHCLQLGGDS
ncbi:hypothetical protein CLOM_g5170 [Closterium sp. NIES-68]|nr:hypothetical protein CLOM_g5170 [Closterium sp. NIES-68]